MHGEIFFFLFAKYCLNSEGIFCNRWFISPSLVVGRLRINQKWFALVLKISVRPWCGGGNDDGGVRL